MHRKTHSYKILKTLLQGKKRLSGEALKRIASFTLSQLTGSGAFMNKNGKEDLYYTSFGLMLALILKFDININATKMWLDKQEHQLSDLVNYAAFIRCHTLCDWIKNGRLHVTLNRLFKHKQTLPAFTHYPHDDKYSPYSQFLLFSLKEDMRMNTGNCCELLTSLSSYHVETGGYANIKGGLKATANATVAAMAVRGQLCGYHTDKDIDFLLTLQDESGGFYAGISAPVPDLLSTATALFLLKCYGVTPRINANDFIDAHWLPSGSFGATLADDTGDTEYTFYGLLASGAIGDFK